MSIREALADRTNAYSDSSRILFSSCKGETHTPKAGFRQLSRRLRNLFKTDALDSRDDFTLRSLSAAAVVVFGNPQQKFTAAEFDVLKQYLGDGGSVLILSSEGGESQNSTNLNYLIEEFGININSDCVIRLSHDKYLHPKEALIADGILNRQVASGLKSSSTAEKQLPQLHSRAKASRKEQYHGRGANFLYARGATLSVQKPSVPFLGTGQVAYPMRRPVGEVLQMHDLPLGVLTIQPVPIASCTVEPCAVLPSHPTGTAVSQGLIDNILLPWLCLLCCMTCSDCASKGTGSAHKKEESILNGTPHCSSFPLPRNNPSAKNTYIQSQ